MPEGSRKWASLSFYRGRVETSTVGASQKTVLKEKCFKECLHTHTHTHTHSFYALQCWMKMMVVWLSNSEVPHHVIAVVSALLISAVPLGLYNWETADSHDPTFTPHSPLISVLKQVANTTNTRLPVPICNLCEFVIPLFFGKHFPTLSFDQEINWGSLFLISSNSMQWFSHGQSWQ